MADNLISIGSVAKQLGVSIDTLRRWDSSGRFLSIRTGLRGHRFYQQADIDLFSKNDRFRSKQWVMSKEGYLPDTDVYCQTRDVFQTRLENLQISLQKEVSESIMSLLCAITGEIGNNSFDHNLGNWPDVPGVYFAYNLRSKCIVLADRGLGILATLRHALPTLENPAEALRVAFTKKLSGRQADESRGNGLKFVRQVVIDNPFTLSFQTGDAYLYLEENDKKINISYVGEHIRGCLAIINY